MNNFFKLEHYKTTVGTEIRAGIVTFLAMAYVIILNPLILSEAGIPLPAAFFATIVTAGVGTIAMGLRANMPLVIAPGMGMNAFFTYSVVKGMGMPWEYALAAIFISGILFILIAVTGVRKMVIDAIPDVLKHAIVVSIGIFIAFVGFRSAGIVVSPPVDAEGKDTLLLMLGNMHSPLFITTVIGIVITLVLVIRKSRFAILIGILSVVVIQLVLMKQGVIPAKEPLHIDVSHSLDAMGRIFEVMPKAILNPQFYVVMFTFLFLDFFDTTGTLIAATTKLKAASQTTDADDADRLEKAMVVDAFATTTGSVLGTTSLTTYLESFAGMDAGARTGLSAIVTGVLLLASFFLYPFVGYVSSQATAAALIMIGIFMMQTLHEINFEDLTEVIVLFFTMMMTLFATSVSVGIAVGFLMYILVMVTKGKAKTLSPVVWILGFLFLMNFIVGHGV